MNKNSRREAYQCKNLPNFGGGADVYLIISLCRDSKDHDTCSVFSVDV